MASNSKEVQKNADEKRKEERGRNWWLVLYPESLPSDWLDKFKEIKCKIVLSPFHDKDFNADGTPKKPHYHIVLMFSSNKSLAQITGLIKSIIGVSTTGSIFGIANIAKNCIIHDITQAIRYLSHMDNPEKCQYNSADIQCFNGADILALLKANRSETLNMQIAIEEYIEQNKITDLCLLSKALRYEHIDWYEYLTRQATYYFTNFIRSYRHCLIPQAFHEDNEVDFKIDEETGEVIE